MKEFVEKLIERLEERRRYNADMFFASHDCFSRTIYEAQMNTYENSIRIVKELAEEYAQDSTKKSQEPKTRIDCIRSMSVEEMADKILASEISTSIDFCQEFSECQNFNEKGEEISDEMCKKCLIKYLNSPVEQKKVIPTQHFEDRFNTVT